MLRIMIVDDYGLVRTGIRMMLENANDMEVVGEAATGEEALIKVRELKPDIVLMDINMPGIGGLEAILRLLRGYHLAKILVISTQIDAILPLRLLELGVAGYLTKQASQAELIEAIRAISVGDHYIDSFLVNSVLLPKLEQEESPPDSIFTLLTNRELQVLLMIARGMGTREIAEKLYLSVKTINTHRRNVLKKLKVKTDVDLALIAIKYKLVDANNQWH